METIRRRLSEDVLHFFYQKTDGSIREAFGTLDIESLPEDMRPKEHAPRRSDDHIVNYYDIEKRGWRSFSAVRFLEFDEDYGL